jgi:hypothetical protein
MQQDKWDRLEYEAMLSPEQRKRDRDNNELQAKLFLEYIDAIRRAENALIGLELAMAATAGVADSEARQGVIPIRTQSAHPFTPGTLKTNPSESED